jgi:hypothetical protein
MVEQRVGRYALTLGMVLALANVAGADSFVNTPPLRNATGAGHVCRLLNMNPASALSPIVAIAKLINASGGVDCQQTFNFTLENTGGELECPGTGIRYCSVDVASNAIADNVIVNLFVEDSGGNALGIVRGMRTPQVLSSTYNITTGGLTMSSGNMYECLFANTGATTINASACMAADTYGCYSTSPSVPLSPGQISSWTIQIFYPYGLHCVVGSTSVSNAKQLRASLSITTPDLLTNSSSPDGNF